MRLIDADAVLAQYHESVFTNKTDYADGMRDVIVDMRKAPTVDAVPVVRCSKCARGFPMENGQYTCNRIINVLDVCDPDHYCADGVRKEEGKTYVHQ